MYSYHNRCHRRTIQLWKLSGRRNEGRSLCCFPDLCLIVFRLLCWPFASSFRVAWLLMLRIPSVLADYRNRIRSEASWVWIELWKLSWRRNEWAEFLLILPRETRETFGDQFILLHKTLSCNSWSRTNTWGIGHISERYLFTYIARFKCRYQNNWVRSD